MTKSTLPKIENPKRILKEGILSKETDAFFFKWQVPQAISRSVMWS
jgi:hypothetical protein